MSANSTDNDSEKCPFYLFDGFSKCLHVNQEGCVYQMRNLRGYFICGKIIRIKKLDQITTEGNKEEAGSMEKIKSLHNKIEYLTKKLEKLLKEKRRLVIYLLTERPS